MKIISKFKDYYDYLKGIYGEDPKLVLDRTKYYNEELNIYEGSFINKTVKKYVFHIGEYLVEGVVVNGKLLFGKEIEPFETEFPKWRYRWLGRDKYHIQRGNFTYSILKEPKLLGDDSPTWKENCPILLEKGEGDSKDYIHHPILKNYSFNRVFDAEKIWIILSEWLSKNITRNEPQVPVGDDKVRIISAGFDLKTSFRGK